MRSNAEMDPPVNCLRCRHWADPSYVTSGRYGFCDELHKGTDWDFFCKLGEENPGNRKEGDQK